MLKVKCEKHSRYSGLRPPRASCQPCMEIWKMREQARVSGCRIVDPPVKGTTDVSSDKKADESVVA